MRDAARLPREGDGRTAHPPAIGPGNVMTVTRINRLARSTFDLFAIVKQIVDARRIFGRWPCRGPTPEPAPDG